MATGILHMGFIVAESIGHEEDSHYAVARALFSEEPDVVMQFSKKYYEQTQEQKEAISRCAHHTYEKIKSMSWQEVLENGTEIGMTMILDTLALHTLSGFTKITSNALVKQISQAVESGALLQEDYAAEVAGFGKLIIEEGAGAGIGLFHDSEVKSIASVLQKSGGKIMQEQGKAFEDFLVQQLGGIGSFKVGSREFDGAVGNIWYEAKSGGYWDMLLSSKDKLENFKSSMGHRLKIANEKGMIFQLHSNTQIPQDIKNWLARKSISYVEWL